MMVVPRTRGGSDDGAENGTAAVSDYEKIREQRIKENQARMQNMGIFDLSRQLHSFKRNPPKRPCRTNPPSDQSKAQFPTRRSSRLQNVAPVNYDQTRRSSDSDSETDDSSSDSGSDLDLDSDSDSEVKVRVRIASSGSPPRRSSRLRDVAPVSYVETTPRKEREPSDLESAEGESLVDDCGKDDGVKDETCHQCRQRTLGDLTHCSKCDLFQGKFCGDCLDMSVCLKRKTQDLMHDDINKEMEEGHLMGKDVNFLGSEHVPAEDMGKLDAATISCDVDVETKKDPTRSTRMSGTLVGGEDIGKLDAGGDVDGESYKEPRRSTRTSIAHVVAEDLGNLEAAGDVVDGEKIKEPRRSTRMRSN
ncbi:hypothetical protein ACLB2K_012974 [Fragaria x ananassa]